jgi:3-hydroxyisobutyrate dehydrogenase
MGLKVGYIGLGMAGGPMCSNLPEAGFETYVSDIDYSRAVEFAKKYSCTAVKAGSDGFKDVDVLITMLTDGNVVRDVLFGKNGISVSLKKGTIYKLSFLPISRQKLSTSCCSTGCVVVDTSTSDPFNSIKLAEELEAIGLDYIDGPITQRRNHETDHGRVTLMYGTNNDAAAEKAMPAFQALAKYIFKMGKVGSGHAMKAINNYVLGASVCALADGFCSGSNFGLDTQTMIDVLNVGSGRVYATEVNLRDEGLSRRYDSGFQMSLLVKDLGINKDLAERMGVKTNFSAKVHELMSSAMGEVGGAVCHTKLLEAWEKWSGADLGKTAQPSTDAIPPPDEGWERLGYKSSTAEWTRTDYSKTNGVNGTK